MKRDSNALPAQRQGILLFVFITYCISWFFWLLLAASKRGFIAELPAMALNLLGGSGPAVAAILVSLKANGITGVRKLFARLFLWRTPTYCYVVALLLPPVILFAVAWCVRMITDQHSGWGIRPLKAVVAGFAFRLFILPLEELGWRGFALPRLQHKYAALSAALLVGLMWSPWHLPLFLIPGGRSAEGNVLQIALFLLLIPLLSILMTWLFNASRGSVLIPLILHASYNSSIAALIIPPDAQLAFRAIGVGAAAFACIIVVLIYGPRELGGRVQAVD